MAFAQPITSERVNANKAAPARDGLHGRGFAPPIVHDALHSAGAPLDAAARTGLENHVGHDLSGVRVHTGALAAASARAVGARAFTVGRDMVFGEGEYTPESAAGRKLLAHEVAHATQQDANRVPGAIPIGAHDANEERAADAVAAGAPPSLAPAGPAVLRRQGASSGSGDPTDPPGWQTPSSWGLKLQQTIGQKFGNGTRFDFTGPAIPPFGFNPNVGLGFSKKNVTGYLNFGEEDASARLRGTSDGDGSNIMMQGLPHGQGTGGWSPGTKKPVLSFERDFRRKPGTSPLQRIGAQLLPQSKLVQSNFPKYGIGGFMPGAPKVLPFEQFQPFRKQTPSLSERMATFMQPKTGLFQPKLGDYHVELPWLQHFPAFGTHPGSKEHDH